MKFVVHSLCQCCPLSRLCICKLARYSQGNFVLVTGKVREFYIVTPVGTLLGGPTFFKHNGDIRSILILGPKCLRHFGTWCRNVLGPKCLMVRSVRTPVKSLTDKDADSNVLNSRKDGNSLV